MVFNIFKSQKYEANLRYKLIQPYDDTGKEIGVLSPTVDFEQFVEKVRGEDYFGIVRSAELEATEAERHSLKLKNTAGPDLNESQSYAITL
jgi:hypothetical protein